jgi:hypothetical protein
MEQLIAELVKQGGGYIVAGLAIWVIKWMADQRVADMRERKDEQAEWKEAALAWAKIERDDKQAMIAVIERNTQAMTRVANVVEVRERKPRKTTET